MDDMVDEMDTENRENNPISLLERAIEIALSAHLGQTQWNGRPYILHPLRVMSDVEGDDAKMVAVLHDVVEDSEWTLDDLQAEGFSEDVLLAISVLTRPPGMNYDQYIEGIAHNRLARQVKLADLQHNMDVRRVPQITVDNVAYLERYRAAYHRLASLD